MQSNRSFKVHRVPGVGVRMHNVRSNYIRLSLHISLKESEYAWIGLVNPKHHVNNSLGSAFPSSGLFTTDHGLPLNAGINIGSTQVELRGRKTKIYYPSIVS